MGKKEKKTWQNFKKLLPERGFRNLKASHAEKIRPLILRGFRSPITIEISSGSRWGIAEHWKEI